MLHISLTGPESTGKSTLAAQLAAHYGTTYAPEFAREYIECTGPHYTLADLEEIAHGQLLAEGEAAAHAHRLVFTDTDLLVVKIWAENAFGLCPEWITERVDQQRYDLVLLMGIDLPWEPDPLREHPHLRQHFYNLYLAELRDGLSNFAEIRGTPEERFRQACFLIDELLAAQDARATTPSATSTPSLFPPMLTLSSSFCHASFSPHGAELTSFIEPKTGLEYLWQADPAVWGRHAPVLFPLVGRLPNDTYLHEGQPYRLGQHGFARDEEFVILRHSASELVFQLTDNPATQAVYPFQFELLITYTLLDCVLTVRWDVRNPSTDKVLPFSIGAHPAFRCPLQPGEQFEDYFFAFDHPVTLERHLLQGGLRNGETAPVLNQQAKLPLTYELFADDALVFTDYDFTRVALRTRKSSRFVRLQFDGFPYLGLWTKGPGAEFVCIEPWHGIASPVGEPQELRDKEGILTLEPGGMFTAAYTIEIG